MTVSSVVEGIAGFAPLLGKNVTLSFADSTITGFLTGVSVWGDDVNEPWPLFKIAALGKTFEIPLKADGDWTLVGTGGDLPTPEEYTITPVGSYMESSIILEPTGFQDYTLKWSLYIPPTQAEHLDEEGVAIAPYGTTYWSSLTAAFASLAIAVRNGDVKYNDGRSAK